jgi:hypothetical protein
MGNVFIQAKATMLQGNIACIAPVGDVDVVVAQQGLDGAAQQRGEVARHGRHHQHLGLHGRGFLAEMQQATEGRGADFLLMHRNCAPAVEHLADLEGGRAWVRGPRKDLAGRGHLAHRGLTGTPGQVAPSRGAIMRAQARSGSVASA